jgi:hypothetical protein
MCVFVCVALVSTTDEYLDGINENIMNQHLFGYALRSDPWNGRLFENLMLSKSWFIVRSLCVVCVSSVSRLAYMRMQGLYMTDVVV